MTGKSKLPKPPPFLTEAEEADWWYKHRYIVEAEIAAAKQAGKTQTPAEILNRELKKRTRLRAKHREAKQAENVGSQVSATKHRTNVADD